MPNVAQTEIEILLRRIAREEAQRVLAENGASHTWSTDELPPDLRHRRDGARSFRRECRSGRYATAQKLGRVWTVDAAEWKRVRAEATRTPIAPRLRLVAPGADLDDEQLAEQALEQAGLRSTRRVPR